MTVKLQRVQYNGGQSQHEHEAIRTLSNDVTGASAGKCLAIKEKLVLISSLIGGESGRRFSASHKR